MPNQYQNEISRPEILSYKQVSRYNGKALEPAQNKITEPRHMLNRNAFCKCGAFCPEKAKNVLTVEHDNKKESKKAGINRDSKSLYSLEALCSVLAKPSRNTPNKSLDVRLKYSLGKSINSGTSAASFNLPGFFSSKRTIPQRKAHWPLLQAAPIFEPGIGLLSC
jgi:hypothetical protein